VHSVIGRKIDVVVPSLQTSHFHEHLGHVKAVAEVKQVISRMGLECQAKLVLIVCRSWLVSVYRDACGLEVAHDVEQETAVTVVAHEDSLVD